MSRGWEEKSILTFFGLSFVPRKSRPPTPASMLTTYISLLERLEVQDEPVKVNASPR